MEYSVYITQSAQDDITESVNYIREHLCNPDAAEVLLNAISDTLEQLAFYPKRHAVAEDEVLHLWEIRYVMVKNYIIFYRIDTATPNVYVIRILHERRDWKTILSSTENTQNP